MKKLSIYIISITLLFTSCVDKYITVPPEEEPILIHTGGIFSMLAKFDTIGFALTIKHDQSIWLNKFTASGRMFWITDLSKYFLGDYKLDSLDYLDFIKTGNNLAIIQVLDKPKFPWRVILLDTTGKIIFEFTSPPNFDIPDTNLYIRTILPIPNPTNLKAYYYAVDSAMNNYIVELTYNYNDAQLIQSKTFSLPYYYFILDAFITHNSLALYLGNDLISKIEIGYLPYNDNKFKFINLGIEGLLYHCVDLPDNHLLLTNFNYTNQSLNLSYINLNTGKLIWSLQNDSINNFAATDAYINGTNMIILGFKTTITHRFSHLKIAEFVAISNLKIIATDGNKVFWTKSPIKEKMVPVGFLYTYDPMLDPIFTSFSYAKTFNYFPATYVIKFSKDGKIWLK